MFVTAIMALKLVLRHKMKKRGVSDVVATVSLVLLTVATVAIIATIVVPLVRNNIEGSTKCLDYNDYFRFYRDFGEEFETNCKDIANSEYIFSIEAGGDEELASKVKGFKISLVDIGSGETEVLDISDGSASLGVAMYVSGAPITIPGPGEVKTYKFTTTKLYERAEIYVVLDDKICEDKTDSISGMNVLC